MSRQAPASLCEGVGVCRHIPGGEVPLSGKANGWAHFDGNMLFGESAIIGGQPQSAAPPQPAHRERGLDYTGGDQGSFEGAGGAVPLQWGFKK